MGTCSIKKRGGLWIIDRNHLYTTEIEKSLQTIKYYIRSLNGRDGKQRRYHKATKNFKLYTPVRLFHLVVQQRLQKFLFAS